MQLFDTSCKRAKLAFQEPCPEASRGLNSSVVIQCLLKKNRNGFRGRFTKAIT